MIPSAYASADKRADLIAAATGLLHEQGFHRSTLADVAGRASVPLGNVYYYFKTKEALAEAVIAAHETALREQFASWDAAERNPRARLRRFVLAPLEAADRVIQFGCPHGSLCHELEKLGQDAPLARAGTRLLAVYIDWSEAQFRALGCDKRRSRALATDLIASVQGTMLLANALRSPALLEAGLRRVQRWLDRARPSAPPSRPERTRMRSRP